MKRFLPSSSPPHHSGGARVQEVRRDLLELDMSWKVLNWTECDNENDCLVMGWALAAEMGRKDLTEVSWVKTNETKKHFMFVHFNEPVTHYTLDQNFK